MPLSEVKGQEHIKKALKRAFSKSRLHHAYLFYGPSGVGKSTLARALAQLLLCKLVEGIESIDQMDACGHCGACKRVGSENHPDLSILRREEHHGKLSREIKIHQLRVLQETLTYEPYEGGRRVVLIEEADKMNIACANALLKTLEEPGTNTHFILCTHRPNVILPTILSRCQHLRFSKLDHQSLQSLINSKRTDATVDAASLLAMLSDGSAGVALSLYDEGLFDELPTLIRQTDVTRGLPDLIEMWSLVDRFEKASERSVRLWLHLLRAWYRALLVIQQGGPFPLIDPRLDEYAQQRVQELSMKRILWRIRALEDAEVALYDRVGSQQKLIIEALLLYLSGRDKQLAEPLLF